MVTLEGATLLVVDDERTVRRSLRRMLELEKATMVEAADAREAIHIIGHDDSGALDAVLVDLLLPDVSGVELIAVLRGSRPNLPVVAITGRLDSPRDLPVPLLRKPFSNEELVAAVLPFLTRLREVGHRASRSRWRAARLCERAASECGASAELMATLAQLRASRQLLRPPLPKPY
jgi:DNA-binding NtrC family response regulator